MICQECHTEVADDLIFCTNCGARLFEPTAENPTVLTPASRRTNAVSEDQPTVLMTEPVYTPAAGAKPPKSASNLKWLALIVALIAIPASIFGILLLQSRNRQIALNAAPTKTPAATPTRRATTNRNSNVNTVNANANRANANTNTPGKREKTDIMNERIEIAPKTHYAREFEVNDETARITGSVAIHEGDKIDGYVYLKKSFDEFFPDETYKVFSFGTSSTTEVRQTLVAEDYVLVFVNNTDKPVVVEGNFSIEN